MFPFTKASIVTNVPWTKRPTESVFSIGEKSRCIWFPQFLAREENLPFLIQTHATHSHSVPSWGFEFPACCISSQHFASKRRSLMFQHDWKIFLSISQESPPHQQVGTHFLRERDILFPWLNHRRLVILKRFFECSHPLAHSAHKSQLS